MTQLITVEEMPGVDLAAYKAKRGYCLHGYWHLCYDDAGYFTPKAMPDAWLRNHRGPVMLDLEPADWREFESEQMQAAVEYCEIISDSKNVPAVYNMPNPPYWGEYDANAHLAALKAGPLWPLFKRQGMILGGCYMMYDGTEPGGVEMFQTRWIDRNCTITRLVAEALRKPWGITTWNHYHDQPSCASRGQAIPREVQLSHLQGIMTHGPDYLVHWGARQYFKWVGLESTPEQRVWAGVTDDQYRVWNNCFTLDTRPDVEAWKETLAVMRQVIRNFA